MPKELTPAVMPKEPVSAAFRSAAREFELESRVLSGPDRGWETSRRRVLVEYVLIRRLGYKLKDVAKYLGRDTATVSSVVSRYCDRMTVDQELKKRASRIVKKDCLEYRVCPHDNFQV